MLPRAWHGAIALAVLFGLVLQVAITVRAPATPPAHAVGTLAGAPLITRLVRVLSFFTVQSNVLSLIVSMQLARDPSATAVRGEPCGSPPWSVSP